MVARGASSDPCDGYGNCISSSISYVRSNPDGSLYLGDEFAVTPSVSLGPNTTSYSYSWSYDGAVLAAQGGWLLQVVGNVSGTYSVTITATFTMVETVGNSTVTLSSSLSTSESVETRAFELTFQTELSNVTNSLHQVLRNPDGSFYHDDEFIVNYTYSFLFMQQRPDIKVIVEPQFDPSFAKLTAYQNSSSTGYFLFTVANSTGTSKITMTAKAFNYQGALLGSKTQKQPFAVVNYAPYFKYFTYMEYNSANSSAYERPFVTLVRYDGNNPGYSYGGDANTAPITAVNDTRERALINSFNFTTTGWGVKANLTSGDISQDLSFWNQTAIDLGTKTTNTTYPVLTFAQRIEKFYFTSDVARDSGLHRARGSNTSTSPSWPSRRGSPEATTGSSTRRTSTSLSITAGTSRSSPTGPSGLDPSDSVNISLVTPDPLDPHLLSSLNQTFGSYQEVAKDFEDDLFPAYSNVMSLKPVSSSGGRWVFLLNDTNLAMTNETQMPYLYITVTGGVGKLLLHRPRRLLVVPHQQDPDSVAPFPERGWILSGPTEAAGRPSSELQPHLPEQPLSRMGLQRELAELHLTYHIRAGEPEQRLRVPLRREQHDLREPRRGRREPGEHTETADELPGPRDDRPSDRRGDEPLGEGPERELDCQ